MPQYEPVIGLEIHVQLGTLSKMFCSCPVPGEEQQPNTCICPVCTGQPGVLPVINKGAVKLGIKAALALNCAIRGKSVFARKNYFYPDLPKNYQISQYEQPLAEKGGIEINLPGKEGGAGGAVPPLADRRPRSFAQGAVKRIGITRAHLEEDAGKLLHAVGSEELNHSLVDFNRCGVPLLEIVSEPDMRSPEEAYAYLTEIRKILQWTGISRCDMEKGELRCDVNISLRPAGTEKFGEKVEVKNLNSFKAVRESLYYEIDRQTEALDAGQKINHETRLWNDRTGKTAGMRSKEDAHDYRYFPDPDLVPVVPDAGWVEKLKAGLPELPKKRKERFISQYSLSAYDAGVLSAERGLSEYFEHSVTAGALPKLAANWIGTDLLGRLNAEKLEIAESPVKPDSLAGLVKLIDSGRISGKMGKDVFEQMWKTGRTADEIVEASGMSQVSDSGQIQTWAKEAIAEGAKAADDYRKGNEKALGALVGAVMKKSKGKANPTLANSVLKELIKKEG
ncbi:MAG: Asp-tRNA(Asn)/Glu-tRNA(Gln) amidotransferase subunit GatB [bacterium]